MLQGIKKSIEILENSSKKLHSQKNPIGNIMTAGLMHAVVLLENELEIQAAENLVKNIEKNKQGVTK